MSVVESAAKTFAPRPFLAASDYMAAKIPNASKAVIANAGHAANIDNPEAFNKAIVDFISGLAA